MYRLCIVLMVCWTGLVLYSCLDGVGVFHGTYSEPTSLAGRIGFSIGLLFNMIFWGIPMIILGIIAVLARPKHDRHGPNSKACPWCAETIQANATVCPHCRRDLYKANILRDAVPENAAPTLENRVPIKNGEDMRSSNIAHRTGYTEPSVGLQPIQQPVIEIESVPSESAHRETDTTVISFKDRDHTGRLGLFAIILSIIAFMGLLSWWQISQNSNDAATLTRSQSGKVFEIPSNVSAADESRIVESDSNYTNLLITEIQESLTQLGYAPGPIDGIAGPKTKAAIQSFQRANRMPVDGQPTNHLLDELQTSVDAAKLGSFSKEMICKAAISLIMGRNPKIINIDRVRGNIIFLSYIRPDDGAHWAQKCRLDGDRIIWGAADGRWRVHPADSKIIFEVVGEILYLTEKHSDGSSNHKSFPLDQMSK